MWVSRDTNIVSFRPTKGDSNTDEVPAAVGDIVEQIPADVYPHLTEMVVSYVLRPGFDFGTSSATG